MLWLRAGEMVGGDTDAVAEAGSTLWPRLAAAYLEARLSHIKPADGPSGELSATDLGILTPVAMYVMEPADKLCWS